MNVLSLFDGISCARVALDRIGAHVDNYYAYEIDANAIKISRHNYPDIQHCGDVTTEDFTKYAGTIDLLCGGSPCQSLSIVHSKDRLNLDGKSKLFYEYMRALEESRPRYFLYENVASMNAESRKIMTDMFGMEPIYINSECLSAQSRPRLYWTNIPFDVLVPKNIVLADILEKDVPEKYFFNCEMSDVDMTKNVCAKLKLYNYDMTNRVYNPLMKGPTLTCMTGGNNHKKVLDPQVNRPRRMTEIEYERMQTLPDNYTNCVSSTARYSGCGNGWTVDVIAHLLKNIGLPPLTRFKKNNLTIELF